LLLHNEPLEMTVEEKQAELEKYRIILFTIFDYNLEHYTRSMVFDEWDPSADHYLRQKQRTENDFQDGKLDSLKQMFGEQIEHARIYSDSSITAYIKEKTGYDIDINEDVPNYISKTNTGIISVSEVKVFTKKIAVQVNKEELTEEEMIDLKNYLNSQPTEFNFADCIRKVMVNTNGVGKNALTEVSISLRGGSGCIYCVNGENLPIKAFWKDKNTIVIETKDDYPVLIRHDQVSSFKDVVKIEYKTNTLDQPALNGI